MVIQNGKTYTTRDGHAVRIICTDRNSADGLPIVGLKESTGEETVLTFRTDGRYSRNCTVTKFDLVKEHSLWDGIEVDTKILVGNDRYDHLLKRHFAKYEDGKVYYFTSGATSYSGDNIIYAGYAELYKGSQREDDGQ